MILILNIGEALNSEHPIAHMWALSYVSIWEKLTML